MILTSRRQQRVLTAMHSSLHRSDPRLVAKFMIFTRLTRDEAIPTVEHVKRKQLACLTLAARVLLRRWLRWRLRGLTLIPAAVAGLVAVVILVGQGQAQGSCLPPARAGSQSSATDHQAAQAHGLLTCPSGQVFITARGR
jgi:hypothetical protein